MGANNNIVVDESVLIQEPIISPTMYSIQCVDGQFKVNIVILVPLTVVKFSNYHPLDLHLQATKMYYLCLLT